MLSFMKEAENIQMFTHGARRWTKKIGISKKNIVNELKMF